MKRRLRLLIALVGAMCVVLGSAAPANAGTLTGATFTAPAGWTTAGAKNTRYDWGFTTATTATLSKVTASVPTGTGGSDRYLALSGASSNYVSTPDSPANSITGDIDLRTRIKLADWTPPAGNPYNPINKRNANPSYQLRIDDLSRIQFVTSANGGAPVFYVGSATNFADGTTAWIRATFDVDNGSGGHTASFYTSADGVTWSLLSSVTQAGTTSIFDSTAALDIGSLVLNESRVYYAEVRNGINGTVVNRFDPNEAAPQAPSSWASSTGETWTVSRSGSNLPADIATDLNVGPISGLPAGGAANYRFIDGVATYTLPTPTSIPSGRAVNLNLGGFTNTATPGTYTSLIRTYDNTGPPPAIVDSATTGSLAFTGANSTTSASAVVSPTLTFTVSGNSSACNGSTPTAGASSTGSSVNLGRLTQANTGRANQTLDVSTNAANGWTAFVRAPAPLTGGSGHTISPTPGSWPPAAFPAVGTESFGYTLGWYQFSDPGWVDYWSQMSASNLQIFSSPGPTASTDSCIGYRAQVGSTTPAGTYSATMIYTVAANY